jgi:hypothetical protein
MIRIPVLPGIHAVLRVQLAVDLGEDGPHPFRRVTLELLSGVTGDVSGQLSTISIFLY